MNSRLLYLAHPVRPADGETIGDNLTSALDFYAELHCVGLTVLCPWVVPLMEGWDDDDDPRSRESGLRRAEMVARLCWSVVLCGPRVSNGMEREAAACGHVIYATGMGCVEASDHVLAAVKDGRRSEWVP